MTIETVGVIGVGAMGKPMCRHVLKGGFPTTVYDVREEPVLELQVMGAHFARSPKEVAQRSQLMLIIVADEHQVMDVCLGQNGILKEARQGSIIVLCSTIAPSACRTIAQEARQKGVDVLDAALIRTVAGAERGNLLLLVGGDTETLDRCRPVFATFAADICHLGDIGSGQVAKIVNNLIVWVCTVAVHEGFSMARATGIDLKTLRQAMLLGSADNWTLREWDLTTQQPRWWDQKDLSGILDLADEVAVPAPLTALVKEMMKSIGLEGARALFAEK